MSIQVKPHVFKTFPEFSKLTLADKKKYQSLISDYPPYAEFSFPFLMTWWSGLNECRVAQLNGNLVLLYLFPGYEEYSGLSVVGTKHIDETIVTVLDYLKQQGEPARLVHVPEFVTSHLKYPELFSFADERAYDECVLSISKLIVLGKLVRLSRWKMRNYLAEADQERVTLENLDLNVTENKELLLHYGKEWESRGGLNDICQHEREVLPRAIRQAEALGLENASLFVDGALHGFTLYEQRSGYVIINYARFSYEISHVFELNAYKSSRLFASQGVKSINIKYDLGLARLRTNKLAFAPNNFLRKYTLTPAD